MRTQHRSAAVRLLAPAVAMTIGLAAGCATGEGGGGPSSGTTATQAAACPLGSWRSTGITASASVSGTTLSLTGGAGATLTIDEGGAVTATFDAMQPAVFTAALAGVQLKGEYFYRGMVSGKVDLTESASPASPPTSFPPITINPPDGPSAPPASSSASPSPLPGPVMAWRPIGQVNLDDLRLTARLTQPASLTIVDNVNVRDFTPGQSTQVGGAVDAQPLLREGTYACNSDTLVIMPTGGGPNLTWQLQRT